MIHLTRSTKDQTFRLRDGWLLIHNGRVPKTTWNDRGPAEAALSLLQKGYAEITQAGWIVYCKNRRA